MIRPWQESDRPYLEHMILDCLETNFKAGADMLPTRTNANVLTELGFASKDAACFVATDGTAPIGYIEWLGMPNALGLDYRGKVLYGLGTYVLSTHRNRGFSHALREAAEAEGKRLGYTKVVGVAYHKAGLLSVMARGFTVAGTHVQKDLA